MATMDHGHHHHGHASDTATDPVCGMKVTIATARNKTEHAGHTYYFCSQRCLGKFTAEPQRYLTPKPAEALPQGHDLHLPHAPGDPPGRAGLVPDLRHGAGAARRRRSTRAPTRSCWT